MNNILATLEKFHPISLAEMDSVALMNRVDTKYLVPLEDALSIIAAICENYRVLEIESRRLFEYRTVYFDTADRFLLNEHLRGKLNREKIRSREYVGTNARFFEVKLKTNKGRTVKRRITKTDGLATIQPNEASFVAQHAKIPAEELQPAMTIGFHRTTLVSTENKERITFDFSLRFDNKETHKDMRDLVIIELKRDAKAVHRTPIMEAMKNASSYPSSLSKYCIGMVLLNETDRYNRYKPKLLNLNKLSIHGDIW